MAKKRADSNSRRIHSLKDGNLERQELYLEVGRAIVHLSDIENIIADIYHSLIPEVSTNEIMDVFFGQGGFEKKLKLADLILQMRCDSPSIEKRWKEITSSLEEHRGVRNLIAHQGMLVESRDGQHNVSLHPPWLKLKAGKDGVRVAGRRVEIEEVRSTAYALEEIRNQLAQLWNDLDHSLYPDPIEEKDD